MAEIMNFPASKIVRVNPGKKEYHGKAYLQMKEDAKNVFDNLCFELFDTYKIMKTKNIEMSLPLLQDTIFQIFKMNEENSVLPKEDPEPPRYA